MLPDLAGFDAGLPCLRFVLGCPVLLSYPSQLKHVKEVVGSLQTLDVSQNEVHRVDGLNAGNRLSLDFNPSITFAPVVLRNAIERDVRIDLRGVYLNVLEDATR